MDSMKRSTNYISTCGTKRNLHSFSLIMIITISLLLHSPLVLSSQFRGLKGNTNGEYKDTSHSTSHFRGLKGKKDDDDNKDKKEKGEGMNIEDDGMMGGGMKMNRDDDEGDIEGVADTLAARDDAGDPQCNPNPCINGDCEITKDDDNGFRCICYPGYVGDACELIDPCLDDPCHNGRSYCNSMTANDGTYTCDCGPAFIGDNCEYMNPCFPISPCLNDGKCDVVFESKASQLFNGDSNSPKVICLCPPNYEGQYCGIYNTIIKLNNNFNVKPDHLDIIGRPRSSGP